MVQSFSQILLRIRVEWTLDRGSVYLPNTFTCAYTGHQAKNKNGFSHPTFLLPKHVLIIHHIQRPSLGFTEINILNYFN